MNVSQKPRLAFFCSGAGTTFEYIVKKSLFNPACLISNNKNSLALKKAQTLGVSSFVFSLKDYSNFEAWDEDIKNCLEKLNVDLVILAGFLAPIGKKVLKSFCVINSHPSLLPQYGGKGMYGIHVHKAVCDAKEKWTGITIHYVNEEYDKGAIIAQRKVEVLPDEKAEDLQNRIKEIEKPFYSEAIQQVWEEIKK